MDEQRLAAEWTALMAPQGGDIRRELVHEAAEYLGIATGDAWDRLRDAGDRFRREWSSAIGDSTDAARITEVPAGTVTSRPSIVSLTCVAEPVSGVPKSGWRS